MNQTQDNLLELFDFTEANIEYQSLDLSPELEPTFDFGETKYEFFLKPAKSREDSYDWQFPNELLCSPYKYDLKIQGDVTKDVQIVLVDSESHSLIEQNGKPGCFVEQIEEFGNREIVVRFLLNFCSFHFKKKSFKLFVYMSGKLIYTSTPFMTYARRRESNTPKKQSVMSTNFTKFPSQPLGIQKSHMLPDFKKSNNNIALQIINNFSPEKVKYFPTTQFNGLFM